MEPVARPSVTSWLGVSIAAALTLLVGILSPNEYLDQGISGAADCDASLAIMMFVIPAAALAVSLLVLACRRLYTKQGASWYLVGALCLVCLVVCAWQFFAVMRETHSAAYLEVCVA